MQRLKERYDGFHQHMLIAESAAVKFYERMGFARAGKTEPIGFTPVATTGSDTRCCGTKLTMRTDATSILRRPLLSGSSCAVVDHRTVAALLPGSK